MIGSAQKAPVTSAALSALNLAVVRQVVFERAAEQIFEKSKRSTEAVVQTAEESRARSKTVDIVIEQNEGRTEKSIEDSKVSAPIEAQNVGAGQAERGQSIDIEV